MRMPAPSCSMITVERASALPECVICRVQRC